MTNFTCYNVFRVSPGFSSFENWNRVVFVMSECPCISKKGEYCSISVCLFKNAGPALIPDLSLKYHYIAYDPYKQLLVSLWKF